MGSARLRVLLPAAWVGAMGCIALLAAPASFAVLPRQEAGRVVARLFSQEAALSLVAGLLVVLLERKFTAPARDPAFSVNMMLALGAVFCTVVGYYALQPLMEAARAGQGAWSFGALHGVSLVCFGLKLVLVAALAWRAATAAGSRSKPPTS